MRLSEAIRLGAMLKPQCRGDVYSNARHSCALGAAMDSVGVGKNHHDRLEALCSHFPILRTEASHPVVNTATGYVSGIILHLNDVDKWTRGQIADWVETIELQHFGADGASAVEALPVLAGEQKR